MKLEATELKQLMRQLSAWELREERGGTLYREFVFTSPRPSAS